MSPAFYGWRKMKYQLKYTQFVERTLNAEIVIVSLLHNPELFLRNYIDWCYCIFLSLSTVYFIERLTD